MRRAASFRRARRVAFVLSLVVAAAVLLNAVATTREVRPATADTGTVLDLPGPDLQVREDGPRGAPAIVLLHGYASSMRWWDRVVPALAREHFVVRFDLLGHGGSAKPRERDAYDLQRQGEALAEALEKIGVERALVVGHSMGGQLVGALATAAPQLVKGMVLLDTFPRAAFLEFPLSARVGLWPVLGPLIKRTIPDSRVSSALADAFADGTKVPEAFVADYRDMTYSSYKNARQAAVEYADEEPLDDRMAELGLPLLVVWGAADELVEDGALDEYRDVPGVTVRELSGVGHSPQWEAPATTVGLIRAFERRIEKRGGGDDRRTH